MSYIYKITNDINNKVYIGKTDFSIQKRFQEHCRDALKESNGKRPLYLAMKKYGIEHFSIELVQETKNSDADEIFWIDYYDSYANGYNATYGGDGKHLFSHDDILNRLYENPYPSEVAKEFGCSPDLVRSIAKENQVEVKNKASEQMKLEKSKKISAYTKDNVFVKSFDSTVSIVSPYK